MKRYLVPGAWAIGMLVLILDGKTAMTGAAEGITLCLQTLIPSLFPFFLLSAMLTSSLSGGGLLLAGILGGYPVGAANAAQSYRAGHLTRPEAERMAVLCNCAGPSFIFGIVSPILEDTRAAFLLWGVYLISILALWAIFPKVTPFRTSRQPITLQQALHASIRSMAGVCGWVILFRVLIAILDRWVLWILPQWGRISVYGLVELCNGCLALTACAPALRFMLAAGFISFGGLCVLLQTACVTQGLSMRLYFPGKLFQTSVSMLAASFLVADPVDPGVRGILLAISVLSLLILRKSEKRCGNRSAVIV